MRGFYEYFQYERDMKTIDFLIENNMDVDEHRDSLCGDATYLMKMCFCWNFEYVKKLVEAGADVNRKDCKGYTALFYVFDYPFDSSRKTRESFFPVELLDYLVSNGAMISNEKTGSPIFKAILLNDENRIDAVKWLINNGVDINTKNENGKTPLQFALDHGKLDIAELLKNAGSIVKTPKKTPVVAKTISKDFTISTEFIIALVALSKIVTKYEKEIFLTENKQKLYGLLSDLFPQNNKFYKILKQALVCDFAQLLVDATRKDEEDKEKAVKKSIETITINTGLSENDAKQTVNLIAFALGWEIDI